MQHPLRGDTAEQPERCSRIFGVVCLHTRQPFSRSENFLQAVGVNEDRLASFAEDARKRAILLPSAKERDEMLGKVGRADAACHK
jgi:hypothetical protein